jgi:hypothetical protein
MFCDILCKIANKVCDCRSARVLVFVAMMLVGTLTVIIVYSRYHPLCYIPEAMVTDKRTDFGAEDYVTCHHLAKLVVQNGTACY